MERLRDAMLHTALIEKLENRTAHIGIVGLGYVGLPLAVAFAEAGFKVTGVDVDTRKVNAVLRGESYIQDVPSETLQKLLADGRLSASATYDALHDADSINICVPTPLSATKDPDLTYVLSAMHDIEKIAHTGMMVILESTTYPGTTEDLVVPPLVDKGFTPGVNIFIAFSGERIDPGNKHYKVHNTPKVIGGLTPSCMDAAKTLYSTIVEQVVPVSSPRTAEMVKLLENTFRAVNIGLVNEVAMMCDLLDIDVWETIKAASTKPFGFMPFYPGPGVGGHCIPLDPHYLSWKMRTLNFNSRFIELASEINAAMPHYVLDKVTDALNEDCKSVNGSKIVLLGVAYKPDIDDVRESPALAVIELLQHKGAKVVYHDPHVASLRVESGTLESSPYSETLLKDADCVVITTNHSSYDWQQVADTAKVIVDTRNATTGLQGKARVVAI